jgi:hypothetical protein
LASWGALTSRSKGGNEHKIALLRRIVVKRRPELASRLDQVGQRPLTPEEREVLRELVADEFAEAGLQQNDEPTGHGLALESVIDWLGMV